MTSAEPCENCRTPVTFVSAAGPITRFRATVTVRDEEGPQIIGRDDRLPRPVWSDMRANGFYEVDLISEWDPRSGSHMLSVDFSPHTRQRCQTAREAATT